MTDELTVCAAAFFRNKGKTMVTVTEFLMGVSMDFHWMPYGDAKKLLSLMTASGALARAGEYLKPDFDVSSVEVPVAYRPSDSILRIQPAEPSAPVRPSPVPEPVKEPAAADTAEDIDPLPMLMDAAAKAGMKKRDFISGCNVLQKKLNIDILAAGLIVLRDHGADISPYTETVYRAVSKK